MVFDGHVLDLKHVDHLLLVARSTAGKRMEISRYFACTSEKRNPLKDIRFKQTREWECKKIGKELDDFLFLEEQISEGAKIAVL